MANYCSNTIVFYSKDRMKLAVLLRKINAACDSRQSGFFSLLVLHGYSKKEISGIIDGRDSIISCDSRLTKDQDGDTFSFGVDTETAWSPHVEVFRKILADKYENAVRMVYRSEEPGFGIYINSDTEGKYITDRYMVDCCHFGEYHMEYFDTFAEAVEWIQNEYTEVGFSSHDTESDIENKINKLVLQNEEDFFAFHYFEPDCSNEERKVA